MRGLKDNRSNHYLEQSQHLFHPNAPVNGSLPRRNLRLRYELKVFSVQYNMLKNNDNSVVNCVYLLLCSTEALKCKCWRVDTRKSHWIKKKNFGLPTFLIVFFSFNIVILMMGFVQCLYCDQFALKRTYKNLLLLCFRDLSISIIVKRLYYRPCLPRKHTLKVVQFDNESLWYKYRYGLIV